VNALRSRAIRLLARREHTRVELARKLARYGTPEEIDSVIASLEACHLQSDTRCAESHVRTHAARLGVNRLRQSMQRRGLDSALIEAQLKALAASGDLPDELERARSVWARKFSALPADAREWARQARFLQGRGFGSDIIRRLLKKLPWNVPGDVCE
jgi:regulatory protein